MNNITDFTDTVKNAVAPLLSMSDTYHVPGQIWRAITAPGAAVFGLGMITTFETMAGIFSCIGIIVMLINFRQPYTLFSKGKAWAMLGATCAIVVWGIGFMVVAGDYFMAWQAKENSLSTQLGAMIYMIPSAFAVVILLLQRE